MEVSPLVWTLTLVITIGVLIVDVFVIGRRPHEPSRRELTAGLALYISLAILKFGKDQTGVGIDYRGLHHIGLVVDDIDEWTKHLEALGAPNITRPEDMPPHAHFEIKFRAPDNVVFDISHTTWPGAAPVDPATTKQPLLEPAE